MRIILSGILASIFFLSPKAQTYLPLSGLNYTPWHPLSGSNLLMDSGGRVNQKWYLSKYGGVSAGIGFFNGQSVSFISAPVGLQLNRTLTNNLVAFARVSAAPVFFNPMSFTSAGLNKGFPGNSFSNDYRFGMSSGVQMGLMYINDAKTFSISGSFGVETGTYPAYPSDRINRKKQ